jgi:hypothetical protein
VVGLPAQTQADQELEGATTRGREVVRSSRAVLELGEKVMRKIKRGGDNLASRELAMSVGSKK